MTSIALPGGRDVRATLNQASDTTAESSRPLVVACPPHPQHGGTRRDPRLRTVSESLTDRGVDCLRFDYGPWDGCQQTPSSRGECRDAATAVNWAVDRTDRVGLFGYSFGGVIALSVAADRADLEACSVVAPMAALQTGEESVDAVGEIECPTQLVYGTRDTTVDWKPAVARARERNSVEVVDFEADHFFVGHTNRVADTVATFFERL